MKKLSILIFFIFIVNIAFSQIAKFTKVTTPLVYMPNSTVAPIPSTSYLYALSNHLYWGNVQIDVGSVPLTATSPMSVAGNDIHILPDTLTAWWTKQAQGATAYSWGNHGLAGYEIVVNKQNSTSTSQTKYPTWHAIKAYSDSIKGTIPLPTTYTATTPVDVTGSVISILPDTLASWRDKQNKGATAYSWGNNYEPAIAPTPASGGDWFYHLNTGTGVKDWAQQWQGVSNRIYTTNRVGIGVTSPATRLHVADTATIPVIVGGSGTGSTLTFQSTTGAGTTDYIRFLTGNNTEAARFTSGGRLGIGTTAPQRTSDLVGTSLITATTNEIDPIRYNGAWNSIGHNSYLLRSEYTAENTTPMAYRVAGVVGHGKTGIAKTSLLEQCVGVYGVVENMGTGNITFADGLLGITANYSTDTIKNARNVLGQTYATGGVISTNSGFSVGKPILTGTAKILNDYGIRIISDRVGTSASYGIYQESTKDSNIFYGKTQFTNKVLIGSVSAALSVSTDKLCVEGVVNISDYLRLSKLSGTTLTPPTYGGHIGVSGSGTGNMYFTGRPVDATGYGEFHFKTGSAYTDGFVIRNNGDGYLRGNFGIGTTNPLAKLHVNGPAIISDTLYNAIHSGGKDVGSTLTLQSTTGAGTTSGIGVQIAVGTNGATKAITVLNNGNVGVGKTNPNVTLDVVGTSSFTSTAFFGGQVQIVGNIYNTGYYYGTNYTSIDNGATELSIYTRDKDAAFIRFGKGNDNTTFTTEFARFNSTGNFSIGTTNPLAKLHVNGNTRLGAVRADTTTMNGLVSMPNLDKDTTNANAMVMINQTTGKISSIREPNHFYAYYTNNTGFTREFGSQDTYYPLVTALTSPENHGFAVDNDTCKINYDLGMRAGHIKHDISISFTGSNGNDIELQLFNVTDNAEVPTSQSTTVTGSTNRANLMLTCYDINATAGDVYHLRVKNLLATSTITVYRITWYGQIIHY